tara:strand:+ start:356 stop:1420 length:1065 start_codon:yes stop_codon:yes gene_type:complete
MRSNIKYFKKNKIISLDNFINDVLYNRVYGYYTKKIPFGKDGDFITAPSISPLFSEMVAIWIVSYWESLNKPKNFNVIELGPGNGALYNTLVKTFHNFPEFEKSSNFYLFEKSNYLKKIQKKNIKNKKVIWVSNLNKIKKGPALFFGNEFFDAIPVKQYEKINNKLYEHCVCLDEKNNIKKRLIKASAKSTNMINNSRILSKLKFIEYPKLGFKIIAPMVEKVNKLGGGIMLIDYGYIRQKNLNSLQSIKKHKKNNLFSSLGNADITSLVNFELLKDYFIKKRLHVEKIVPQNYFLKKIGIMERANILSRKMTFKEKADLFFRLKRLLDTNYMGDLFKVILAHKKKKKKIKGFY